MHTLPLRFSRHPHAPRALFAAALLALALPGCSFLTPFGPIGGLPQQGVDIRPPSVQARGVRLVQHPTPEAVARWYCDQQLSPFLCQALGPTPSPDQLKFVFDVDLAFTNPNTVPVPVVAALVALTVFPEGQPVPGRGSSTSTTSGGSILGLPTGRPATSDTSSTPADDETLGTVCVALCEDDGSTCVQDPDACRLEGSIRDIDDFAGAAIGFLTSLAVGQRRFEDLRVRTIPAGQSTTVSFRLSIDPERMLRVLVRVFSDIVTDFQAGRTPQLVIPYELEGTAFLNVEGFGRFAAEFPRYEDRWSL